MKIALVTARPRPEVNVDYDLPGLHRAVIEAGADAVITAWDDPSVKWEDFDLVVIRSPWDYSWRPKEFLAWLDRCAGMTPVANSPVVVHWNSHKTYLNVLAEKSVPVVPTHYIRPGERTVLPDDVEFVVKPAVGGGARYVARYQPEDRNIAEAHVRRIHAEQVTAMVQPYLQQIDSVGERALVFVGGQFLHAIRKNAVLWPGLRFDERRDAHPGTQPWSPTPEELAVAQQAITAIPFDEELLYARVDMVSSPDSGTVVTELELIEPGLYLRFHPGSAARVAATFVDAALMARDRVLAELM